MTHKCLYTQFFFTRSLLISFTQRKSLAHFFSCMCLYALRLTRARDHTRALTHKYIQKLLRAKSCTTPPKKYTSACTHQNCLQFFLHAKTFMHKRFHMFFCTQTCYTQKKCAQEASHQDALTHTQKHTHTESSTQKMFLRRKTFQHTICCRNFHTHFLQTGAFTRINFDTQAFLHTGAFTHRKFKRRIFYTP